MYSLLNTVLIDLLVSIVTSLLENDKSLFREIKERKGKDYNIFAIEKTLKYDGGKTIAGNLHRGRVQTVTGPFHRELAA